MLVLASTILLLGASSASASASSSTAPRQDASVAHSVLYKQVRSLYAPAQHASQQKRELASKSAIRCFTKCTEEGMNAEECLAYIKSELGEDLSNHVVPDLQVKVQSPRDPSTMAATYFEVGIPTNFKGDVACDINNADIYFPYEWMADNRDGPVQLPVVNCLGLDANACCNKFMARMAEDGISTTDTHGHCLSCWVNQDLLAPDYSAVSGEPIYRDSRVSASTGECETYELTMMEVQSADATTRTKIDETLIPTIQDFQANGATCDQLHKLEEDLQFHARGVPTAMQYVASMLCGYCVDETSYAALPEALDHHMSRLIEELTKNPVKSDVNEIVIYTNTQGDVIEPPKIGGSRAEVDNDLDDPDCPDFGTEAASEPETPGSESKAEPEKPSEPETEPEAPESETKTEPETPSEPETEPETPASETKTEPETPSEPDTEPETPSEPETEPETPSEPENPSEPEVVCESPYVKNSNNECVCPGDLMDMDGSCACPSGSLMSFDGASCVPEMSMDQNAQMLCPDGAYMENGICLSCNCGFCPTRVSRDVGEECCEINGAGNNCKPPGQNSANPGCNFAQDNIFYPGYSDQRGNVCSGVEVKQGADIPVGCGCKPSSTAPCTFDADKDGCYVCSVEDLADSSTGDMASCSNCRKCLKDNCGGNWPAGLCQGLLDGSAKGASSDWSECLASSGEATSGGSTNGKGGNKLRGLREATDCALGCNTECYKSDAF